MTAALSRIVETGVPSRTRPIVWFFVIASAIPMLIVLSIAFAPGFWDWMYGRPFVYEDASLEAAQRLGYDHVSTNLVERVPAAFLEPVLWMPLIYAGAPTIAAIIVICLLGQRGALRSYLSRFNPLRGSAPIGRLLGYYALLIACVLAIRFGLSLTLGVSLIDWTGLFSISAVYAFVAYAFVDQGGLLEECGWRGFALPYLQGAMSTPLGASVLLGLIWSFWHIPRDLLQWDDTVWAFISEYGLFTIGTVTMSIVITFFFNKLNGSLWPAVMFHGLINQTFDVRDRFEATSDYSQVLGHTLPSLAIYGGVAVLALVLLAVSGPRLGLPKAEIGAAADSSASIGPRAELSSPEGRSA
ncbi:MAG: CPBP family intramembrane metalloprotease [Maricaulaceae bacterium]|jgi:hypothetical protein